MTETFILINTCLRDGNAYGLNYTAVHWNEVLVKVGEVLFSEMNTLLKMGSSPGFLGQTD